MSALESNAQLINFRMGIPMIVLIFQTLENHQFFTPFEDQLLNVGQTQNRIPLKLLCSEEEPYFCQCDSPIKCPFNIFFFLVERVELSETVVFSEVCFVVLSKEQKLQWRNVLPAKPVSTVGAFPLHFLQTRQKCL